MERFFLQILSPEIRNALQILLRLISILQDKSCSPETQKLICQLWPPRDRDRTAIPRPMPDLERYTVYLQHTKPPAKSQGPNYKWRLFVDRNFRAQTNTNMTGPPSDPRARQTDAWYAVEMLHPIEEQGPGVRCRYPKLLIGTPENSP